MRQVIVLVLATTTIGLPACGGRLCPCPETGTSGGVSAHQPAPAHDAYANVHGLKMHYRRQGSGPPLVLLHGGSGSAELCWGPAFAFFAPRFDVIAPDQMGHGRTADLPERPFDYHAMAEDTVELMAQLGVTGAFFVGWSDGGNVALDIAMHHPALVKKLVTTGANFSLEGLKPEALEALRRARPEEHPQFIRDDYAKLSPDGAAHWPVFFARLGKMWTTQPAWTPQALATIKAPALIIAGDDDIMTNEHTARLATAIPGARLAILPRAGHMVVLDDAPRWNAVVLGFLNEPPASSPVRR